jgi:transcriptional regulator GlxA family with amidase domain
MRRRATGRRRSGRAPRAGSAPPRRVLLVAGPGTEALDLIGPFEVFTSAAKVFARGEGHAAPLYQVEVVTCSRQRTFTTNSGLRLNAHHTFREVRGEVDTLLVAGGDAVEQGLTAAEAVRWLRRTAARSRRVGSVCTGAFLLARAGLLEGRRITTHWNWCGRLATLYPGTSVDPDPIFIRDGKVYTSAGVTAGMDLALALVEEDHGPKLALEVARHLVLYLRRPGGQSQFSAALSLQASERQPLQELQSWMLENLHKPLTVATLAARVAMSPRNFARIFQREMRLTPGRFVERLRVETARRRLQETRVSLKRIAQECGFGSLGAMRTVFRRVLGVPPGQYRQHFRSGARPG